jgi:hypothetical protein
MGNLITAGSSIFIPFFVKTSILPAIYDPYRWGGIPWDPPNIVVLTTIKIFFNLILLQAVAFITGIMTTMATCDNYDFGVIYKNTFWPLLGFIIGNIVITVIPIIKATILPAFMWLPYAHYIVHGSLVAIFVLIFGAWGSTDNINAIC